MKPTRTLSREEKEALVLRLRAGERVGLVAKEAGVLRKSLYEWREAYSAMGIEGLNRKRGPKPGGSGAARARFEPPACAAGPPQARAAPELAKAQARIAELERLVGRQQMDLDFFREALRSWDATSRSGDAPISSRRYTRRSPKGRKANPG
jgi:hypothetical protein